MFLLLAVGRNHFFLLIDPDPARSSFNAVRAEIQSPFTFRQAFKNVHQT